jgi:hypothetical protein
VYRQEKHPASSTEKQKIVLLAGPQSQLLRAVPFLSKTGRKQPSTFQLQAVSKRSTGKRMIKAEIASENHTLGQKYPERKNDCNFITSLIIALQSEKFKGKNYFIVEPRPFTIQLIVPSSPSPQDRSTIYE